ncbi:hypothetical protein ACKWTF_012376 [Chironomus riparius]
MIKLRFILPSVLLLVALCWAYLEEFPRLEMEDTCFGSKHVKIPPTMNDKFADLLAIAQGRVDENSPKNHEKVVIHEKLNSENPTFAELTNFVFRWHSTNLELFQYSISKNEMYPENEKVIKHLLKDLKTLPVYFIEYHEHYTEHFKIFLYLQTETRAIMKPGRAKRDEHAHPNHFYWDDYDRHNAEIAAYHLDRILGFRRAIPHVGRYVNIMEEIYPFAFDELLKTFYVTPGGNNCMTGRCENYCDTNHPTCGNPNIIEASLAASLPTHDNATRDVYKHPWKRSFDKKRQAIWEVDQNYCDTIRNIKPFKSGKRILDIVDLAIMDFLTGNMNRKYYEMFKYEISSNFRIIFVYKFLRKKNEILGKNVKIYFTSIHLEFLETMRL